MANTSGTRLGPYELVAPIGAGGMGEVWKARDTRLDRSVAIKMLPADFADNAQLRLRLEREAKAISQLNHPNICSLFDVGENYLVMELLEGETLADRVVRGPLPIHETLKIGAQIADALDRAHRAGIIHRDLKPGNIMLTKSGAKLLDFGLAKSGAPPPSAADLTQQRPLTQEGTILGTFQYMAPEQLEGLEADARTDIFALGAVLYEMATGRRAFTGTSRTSLIAAIVTAQPQPISQIQPLTPPALEHVVQKCLAKDPEARWQSAFDVAEELRWIGEAGSSAGVPAPILSRRKTRERLWWSLALLAVAAVPVALWLQRPAPAPLAMSIAAPRHAPFDLFGRAELAPDGKSLVFVGFSEKSGSALWLRRLDDPEPHLLAQTQGATLAFWSPDGANIGFFADGKLKRIAAAGGPPRIICDAPTAMGGSWNRNGVIAFASEYLGPINRVDANGGKPVAITKVGPKEEAHRYPFFLPDGDHFIFLGDASKTEDHHIKVGSLRDGSVHELMQAVTNAIYAEPGYVLYVRGGSLLAQRFDAKSLTFSGEPQTIAEDVWQNDENHHFEFTASNGNLVYRSVSPNVQLTWVDRNGNALGTVGEPRRVTNFRIAPDQKRIAVGGADADGRPDDIFLFDPARNVTSRVTFDPASEMSPVWSPDGTRLAFTSMRSGLGDTYVIDLANPSAVQKMVASASGVDPSSWSRDGKTIVLNYATPQSIDIWTMSAKTGEAHPYLATPFDENEGVLSPDGQWIAYVSTESGGPEVYVERFPTHAARRQISTGSGFTPRWRADGKELFYVQRGGQIESIDMTSDSATPKPLFRAPNGYDASPDGQRFLVALPVDNIRDVPLTFVSNWTAKLHR